MTKNEVLKTAREFTAGLLGEDPNTSMCFAVCASLEGYLRVLCGVEYKMAEGFLRKGDCEYHHCWLEAPDGSILDPTASQFNHSFPDMPDIYMGEKPEWYENE